MSIPEPLGKTIFGYRPVRRSGAGECLGNGIIVCEGEYVWYIGGDCKTAAQARQRAPENRIAGKGAELLDRAFFARTTIEPCQMQTRLAAERAWSKRLVSYRPGQSLEIGCVEFTPEETKEFERLWDENGEVM